MRGQAGEEHRLARLSCSECEQQCVSFGDAERRWRRCLCRMLKREREETKNRMPSIAGRQPSHCSGSGRKGRLLQPIRKSDV